MRLRLLGIFTLLLAIPLLLSALFTEKTFRTEKTAMIGERNALLLLATANQIKLGLRNRFDDFRILIPRAWESKNVPQDVIEGIGAIVRQEILSVRFLSQTLSNVHTWRNEERLQKYFGEARGLELVDSNHPFSRKDFPNHPEFRILNRSVLNGRKQPVAVATLLFDGASFRIPQTLVAVDITQDLFKQTGATANMGDVFLVKKDGSIISHPNALTTTEYASKPFLTHLEKLVPYKTEILTLQDISYWVSSLPTGLDGIHAVALVKAEDTFARLPALFQKFLVLFLVMVALTILVVHFLIPTQMAVSPAPTKIAEPPVPEPDLEPLPLEEKKPTLTFDVQPVLETPEVDVFFVGTKGPRLASSAVWKLEKKILFYVADFQTTQIAAPKNLAEQILQGALSAKKPETATGEALTQLNQRLHQDFRGKIAASVSIGLLDMETARLSISNAALPPVLCLRAARPSLVMATAKSADKDAKRSLEALIAPGEKIGTKPDTSYTSVQYLLRQGDRMLMVTQGALEAENGEGMPWGTDGLTQVFSSCGALDAKDAASKLAHSLSKHAKELAPNVAFLLVDWKAIAKSDTNSFYEFTDGEATPRETWLYERQGESREDEAA